MDAPAAVRTPVARTQLAAVVGVVVVGVAALAGGILLGHPAVAPVFVAVVLAVPLLLVRPRACLVLATVVEMANLSDVADQHGVPGLYQVNLALGATAALVAVWRGRIRPGGSPVFLFALLYLTVQLVAAVASSNLPAGLSVVEADGKALVWLFVITTLLLTSVRAPSTAARALVLTLAALALLTLVQQFVLGNATTFGGLANVPLGVDIGAATPRHSGPQADVNFWGRLLVLALPFALSLARLAATRWRGAGWLLCALWICGGIVLTGSRGTLLAAFAAVVLWALLSGGRYRRALLFAPVLVGLALLAPGVGSRLSTLLELTGSSGVAAVDDSLIGRVDAQRVALQMLVDHPGLGVGPGNFLTSEPDYLRRLGLDSVVLAPHNSYLEAAAETGIVGLLAWLLLLGSAVVVALRARRLWAMAAGSATGDPGQVVLGDAVVSALAGWAVASVFLHLATFRSLLLVMAVGVALDIHARRWAGGRARQLASMARVGLPLPAREDGPAGGRLPHRQVRGRVIGAVVALLVASAGLWTADREAASPWEAESSVQLVVKTASGQQPDAYALDVLTRPDLIRTFATITADPQLLSDGLSSAGLSPGQASRLTVRVSNTPPSGIIQISVGGPDAASVRRAAEALRDRSARQLNSLSPLYGAQSVRETTVQASPPITTLGASAVVLLLAAVGVVVWWWRRRRVPVLPEQAAQPAAASAGQSGP